MMDPMGLGFWSNAWDITSGIGLGVYDFGSGAVTGTYQLVRHPVQSVENVYDAASTSYANFRHYGAGPVEAVYHTVAAGGVSILGGGAFLNGYDAAKQGDLQGATREFANGATNVLAVAVTVCKVKDLSKAGKAASGRVTITDKIAKQMGPRGWTEQQIAEAIKSGQQIRAINKATGNPAIRYVHPQTGQSVVVDTVTNEVIQIDRPGFLHGPSGGDLP